ncbi:MAG: hypothetical protein LUQ61_03885, partial [Methanoregulaceae archaeon]|nr:hypothetical protein [Methanoregulaceae archaeon]
MLLVTGASAVTFVINDGDASVSLAASQNHDVAFSVVAADNPDSFSASLSASDGGGASASQESNIGGADRIFSATAGISSDGDYAYTFTETAVGSTETTQQAQASQGNNASASQDTRSTAVAGAATSNGTETDGTTASQSVAFILGVNNVNLSGTSANNASAYQNGIFAGIAGNTLGIARAISGDISFTRACIAAGGMTFDNTATTDSATTSVAQDVGLVGVFGSASTLAIDNEGPLASQSAIFAGGILEADQAGTTDSSAVASQTGTFAGLFGGTLGLALSPDADISETHAGVFVGGMTFDDTTVAEETTTTALQDVLQAGLLGSSHAGSIDQNGNIASQDGNFVGGILHNDQSTDTLSSANALQNGGFIGLGAMTNGLAVAADGGISHSNAGVVAGGMIFNDEVTAQDTFTSTGQNVHVAGLAGTASVESSDGLNSTSEGADIVLGSLDTIQEATTSTSAHAFQSGTMSALYGTTWGDAASGSEQSWTDADVVIGAMTFGSAATADGSTEAGQIVGINGNVLPVAGAGRAVAGSDDGAGNVTETGSGIILGNLGVVQQTDTSGSAHSAQLGGMSAGVGKTWGDAASGAEQSWTEAGVIIGTMTFDNVVTADGSTEAGQAVGMTAIAGQSSAVSNDGAGNVTGTGANIILGDLGVIQQTDTRGSAHTTQFGMLSAGLGKTWGDAASGGEQSWTNSDVVVGEMTFGNAAEADGSTEAAQTVGMTGLAGEASAGSDDGAGNTTEVGAGVILGNLGIIQETETGSSAYAAQIGRLNAGFGNTWGEAASGAEQSWTDADVVVGSMTFGNGATANGGTTTGQIVGLTGLAGEASAGSDDGAGNVTGVGAGVILGNLGVIQQTDTGGSAHTAQSGRLNAGLGNTWGNAASGSEQSWTEAGVVVGDMTFGNAAEADGDTEAGQIVGMAGLAGEASAGSDDGVGNGTKVGAEVILGNLDVVQLTDTGGSAHTAQSGRLNAGLGNTWGNAA